LGIDLGGTGVKAGIFDAAGQQLGAGHAGFQPATSPEGYVELPIETIYTAARDAVRQAVNGAGVPVRALAISSQGQTFVTLDDADRPLHPAILWYDSRADAEAQWLQEQLRAQASSEPLPLVQSIATAPKIRWLREHHPEQMRRARRYLLLMDYLSYRLTGRAVTDPCNAHSTALYADGAAGYCATALAAMGIDEGQLAAIQPAASPIATLKPEIAAEWGLSLDTLVVTGTNDQYAGAIGTGNCRPGIISETSGTCLALVTLSEQLPASLPPGLLGGYFPLRPYQFALAYAKTAGVILDWFRRLWCPALGFADLDALAATVPIGSHGIVALPHFDGMFSPRPHPAAHGMVGNLALSHTTGDIYRAMLESLSFSLRENIELLYENGFRPERIRSIGGGAKSDLWLQMKADVTGLPVERPAVAEAATLGAAMLAAVGAGDFPSIDACARACYRLERTFLPDAAAGALYEEPYVVYQDWCRRAYEEMQV